MVMSCIVVVIVVSIVWGRGLLLCVCFVFIPLCL